MKDKTIRIKDIALKAKVSTGTVDRVLHNRGRVSAKVQEKVLKIIKEMDYEPNLIARALGSKKTYHIAALFPMALLTLIGWRQTKGSIRQKKTSGNMV